MTDEEMGTLLAENARLHEIIGGAISALREANQANMANYYQEKLNGTDLARSWLSFRKGKAK